MSKFAVIDFETTGLAISRGARAIEIGAVIVENGKITQEYESLINPGINVPHEITQLTGISDSMVQRASPPTAIFPEAGRFVADSTLVAHNASFDRAFWNFELNQIGRTVEANFLCTLLIARRLYPWARNHKLATLVDVHQLPINGQHHRALADAHMTANLLIRVMSDLQDLYPNDQIDSSFLAKYQKLRKIDAQSKSENAQATLSVSTRPERQRSAIDNAWIAPQIETERTPTPNRLSRRPQTSPEPQINPEQPRDRSWAVWLILGLAIALISAIARRF